MGGVREASQRVMSETDVNLARGSWGGLYQWQAVYMVGAWTWHTRGWRELSLLCPAG